ncbi:(2Fe-2S)-binding protein [Cohaesibacter haloalkalitolerans]|uniref:(2Fe-2S)-binding protein n=1 Tax=Cohaesibacter haloalkalitolerans TaxID=1162980 RepID=UPI002479DBDE|nr:(2Fe-2S)-binding protein [Cohaesibacter haloalkalitolerans]
MKTASGFNTIGEAAEQAALVPVQFDSKDYMLPEGANLAASLLAAGVSVFRNTPASGAPRGPFCMMGVCYDCLVEIDGVTRQACQTQVSANMQVSKPAIPAAALREDDHA